MHGIGTPVLPQKGDYVKIIAGAMLEMIWFGRILLQKNTHAEVVFVTGDTVAIRTTGGQVGIVDVGDVVRIY